MPSKTSTYLQFAEDTARRITGSIEGWTGFLDTSSRLYKYPYHEQLMIYAQRPDATACASYELFEEFFDGAFKLIRSVAWYDIVDILFVSVA